MSFQFKHFYLKHHPQVFKFGTDAALLATWANIENHQNILEIGSGSGVITLMMAQRVPKSHFFGIDISKEAVALATENLNAYPTPISAHFIHSSLQDYKTELKFNHIVSNPPFFENSTKSPSALKNTTRHTDSLLLEELIRHSKRLLAPDGQIDLVYPVRYLNDLKAICTQNQLFINKITYTRSTVRKPIKRVLVSITNTPSIVLEDELIINGNSKGYSETVFQMLQPFLLKL
tara:strand:- start:47338 stop:48036 length:699 start_codon:yes stop_codon:yes gene_type:complete